MNQTLREQHDEDATSERVSFTCTGCGRDTTFHVGKETFLADKRCGLCQGTNRFGRGSSAPVAKGKRTGTHEGRRKDRKDGATGDQQRAVKRAASQRNRSRRGAPTRPPCRSYDECSHKKHSVATGGGRYR